jgi:hypothetical protein
MKYTHGLSSILILTVIGVAALVFATVPSLVHAETDCTAYDCVAGVDDGQDVDADGLTNFEECCGITLPGDSSTVNSCVDATTGDRTDCQNPTIRAATLDPDSKDLFIILLRQSPSHIPATDTFEFISNPITPPPGEPAGLGITVHEISNWQAGPGRQITANQKSLKVYESSSSFGGFLGEGSQATPNMPDPAASEVAGTVFPLRIKNHIDTICVKATEANCYDDETGYTGNQLDGHFIKYVLAHEITHMLALAVTTPDDFGEFHWPAGSYVVMVPEVDHNRKQGGKKIIWHIPSRYAWTNQPWANLQGACLTHPSECPWLCSPYADPVNECPWLF